MKIVFYWHIEKALENIILTLVEMKAVLMKFSKVVHICAAVQNLIFLQSFYLPTVCCYNC